MEEQQSYILTEEENEEPTKRPVFLSILCVLSFIGNGFMIILGFFGLMGTRNPEAIEEAIDEAIATSPMLEESLERTPGLIENLPSIFSIYLVAAVLCLFGAILMWRLKRAGFFVFAGGKVIKIAGVGLILSTINAWFFPLLMIVLYGLNLKHMKN